MKPAFDPDENARGDMFYLSGDTSPSVYFNGNTSPVK